VEKEISTASKIRDTEESLLSSWVKLWIEMLHDPKVISLDDEQHRFWINCLLMAGSVEKSGALGTAEDIACVVRKPIGATRRLLGVLQRAGMVTALHSVWMITNFAKRQHRPPSDRPEAIRDRVRQHRERKRAEGYQGPGGVVE
jgi:hypothetical protein